MPLAVCRPCGSCHFAPRLVPLTATMSPLLLPLAALAAAIATATATGTTALPLLLPMSPAPSDAFLIGCALGAPACAATWAAPVPPAFRVALPTSRGPFTIFVNTSWAPLHAARFYVLAQLAYFHGGPFYRVLRTPTRAFVAQMGYRGAPAVDLAWLAHRTSNASEAASLSNARGTVAFGTGEVANDGSNPHCTAPQCSLGFSVELFINLQDNGPKLDAMDFAPFGVVEGEGMGVVDSLYAGYGECADLCEQEGSDPYCVPASGGGFAGVNLTRFLSADGGWPYLAAFPRLDRVTAA